MHTLPKEGRLLFLSKKLNIPLILHLHGGAELMTDANLRGKLFEWPFLAHRRRCGNVRRHFYVFPSMCGGMR